MDLDDALMAIFTLQTAMLAFAIPMAVQLIYQASEKLSPYNKFYISYLIQRIRVYPNVTYALMSLAVNIVFLIIYGMITTIEKSNADNCDWLIFAFNLCSIGFVIFSLYHIFNNGKLLLELTSKHPFEDNDYITYLKEQKKELEGYENQIFSSDQENINLNKFITLHVCKEIKESYFDTALTENIKKLTNHYPIIIPEIYIMGLKIILEKKLYHVRLLKDILDLDKLCDVIHTIHSLIPKEKIDKDFLNKHFENLDALINDIIKSHEGEIKIKSLGKIIGSVAWLFDYAIENQKLEIAQSCFNWLSFHSNDNWYSINHSKKYNYYPNKIRLIDYSKPLDKDNYHLYFNDYVLSIAISFYWFSRNSDQDFNKSEAEKIYTSFDEISEKESNNDKNKTNIMSQEQKQYRDYAEKLFDLYKYECNPLESFIRRYLVYPLYAEDTNKSEFIKNISPFFYDDYSFLIMNKRDVSQRKVRKYSSGGRVYHIYDIEFFEIEMQLNNNQNNFIVAKHQINPIVLELEKVISSEKYYSLIDKINKYIQSKSIQNNLKTALENIKQHFNTKIEDDNLSKADAPINQENFINHIKNKLESELNQFIQNPQSYNDCHSVKFLNIMSQNDKSNCTAPIQTKYIPNYFIFNEGFSIEFNEFYIHYDTEFLNQLKSKLNKQDVTLYEFVMEIKKAKNLSSYTILSNYELSDLKSIYNPVEHTINYAPVELITKYDNESYYIFVIPREKIIDLQIHPEFDILLNNLDINDPEFEKGKELNVTTYYQFSDCKLDALKEQYPEIAYYNIINDTQ